MMAYVRRQRAWLTVERLPAYAPELNPIEQVWGNVKTRELANICAPDLASLRRPLRCGFARIRQQPTLARPSCTMRASGSNMSGSNIFRESH